MSPKTGRYFLGRVKRAPHRSEAYHYATVEPLVESDPSGTEWLGPVRDAMSRFQKRGFVHWHDAPLTVQQGSLWQFTVDEHPSAERGDRSEYFQLESPQEPIEVLDLRGWSDEVLLRSALTGDGIPLSPAPAARRILLWLASGVCVGPVLLKPGTAPGVWTLDAPEAHRDASRVPVCRLSATNVNRVSIDAGRWFVSPRLELGQSAGIQNWMPDTQVARSILGRLRKMDPALVKALGVTDGLFREHLEHVESARMGSADPAVERARADRLRGVREAIQRDAALLREAAEALLATDSVRAEVERRAQERVMEEIQARQADIDVALAGVTEQLARLQKQLDEKRAESEALDTALLEKRRELEAKVASFDQEVAARLEEIARRPEAVFAEAAVMRAVLAPSLARLIGGGNGAIHARPPAHPAPGPAADFGEGAPQLGEDAAVRRALAAHAGSSALSLHAVLGLHAAFVAGVAPVVAGSRGYDLLRAYASAVAGGRLHWIPIGSSMMEPHDLLGRFDGSLGRILPGPSGLLDVVRDATRTGRLHVVVLEGFNRAPSEAYLLPILEAVQAGRMGDAARAIPLASPGLLGEEDPYRELARLAWPTSVLIACLPTDGSATLPVPPSVWRFVALIDADDRDHPPMHFMPWSSDTSVSTEILPTFWKDSVTTAQRHAVPERDEATTLARVLSLSARDAADAARVRHVLCQNGLPPADATALAVAATLMARSDAGEKAIDEGTRAAGIAAHGWRAILAEAQRLRS